MSLILSSASRGTSLHVQSVTVETEDMADEFPPGEFFFEVDTPIGFRVRVSRTYWDVIVQIKHPVMAGHEEDVRKCLRDPCEVRQSRSDPSVCLFYRPEGDRRWTCAVAKRLDGEGFLITPYLTDAIKEGEPIWPR